MDGWGEGLDVSDYKVKEERADAMDAMEAGCQPWQHPHPRFIPLHFHLFPFPFSLFLSFFLSSDNGFSSFIRNSGIPEFIPEVCWRNNNSDHVAIIIFTVFFLLLLLLFGENVTQSLRRMWIGSGGYVMKTEPRATDKNEAIFSIAYVNPNLQANNF